MLLLFCAIAVCCAWQLVRAYLILSMYVHIYLGMGLVSACCTFAPVSCHGSTGVMSCGPPGASVRCPAQLRPGLPAGLAPKGTMLRGLVPVPAWGSGPLFPRSGRLRGAGVAGARQYSATGAVAP